MQVNLFRQNYRYKGSCGISPVLGNNFKMEKQINVLVMYGWSWLNLFGCLKCSKISVGWTWWRVTLYWIGETTLTYDSRWGVEFTFSHITVEKAKLGHIACCCTLLMINRKYLKPRLMFLDQQEKLVMLILVSYFKRCPSGEQILVEGVKDYIPRISITFQDKEGVFTTWKEDNAIFVQVFKI